MKEPLSDDRLMDMLVGVEFGYKCAEKGMNIQATLTEARKILMQDNPGKCICRIGSVFVNPKCCAKEHRP
jgi:hypothetical protein